MRSALAPLCSSLAFPTIGLAFAIPVFAVCACSLRRVDDAAQDGGAANEGSDGSAPDAAASCPTPTPTVSCNSTVGLAAPVPLCSPTTPCTQPSGSVLTDEITLPTCTTTVAGQASFNDSPPLEWTDSNGDNRAACVYQPPGATQATPLPLLVFLHGSFGSADTVYDHTLLRQKAVNFKLGADAGQLGFVLASMQGRNLFLSWEPNFSGSHHDQWYRDLGSPSCNPDIRSLDHLIDALVAKGIVDKQRIYLSGWSNGAFMAAEYGIARHTVPTPGGNRIAAVAAYAGADPFHNLSATQSPSCQVSPYPSTSLPLMMVHRDCDALVACDPAQLNAFRLPPGGDVQDWLVSLKGTEQDPNIVDLLIDSTDRVTNACLGLVTCTQTLGTQNHLNWPDGLLAGTDHEPEMLTFLANHPGS
jgi:poly(3-hydroxybutyrate) depolymerase